MARRTKIVCTIGPETSSPDRLGELVEAGMNVARVNLSHGSHDDHRQVINELRSRTDCHGSPIGILADLSGPKIRLGEISGGPIRLQQGDTVALTAEPVLGSRERMPVSYEFLADDVQVGDSIMMNDGAVAAEVVEICDRDVVCQVLHSGEVSTHKGVNFPVTALRVPSLTEKDRLDLAMVLEADVDFVAMSFVRSADDMRVLRGLVKDFGSTAKIIAKIEKREALENFDEILDVSDGIMVARGDLGVETDLARVPIVQKDLIARAHGRGRPVITATQMLESMIHSAMPTRAEVTDVANAILDGTDAVMLSGETAVGRYPVQTVETMADIIEATETSGIGSQQIRRHADLGEFSYAEAIGHSVSQMSVNMTIDAIVVCTDSGSTALTAARFRPCAPIIAGTPWPEIARGLTISWGVIPVVISPLKSTDQMISEVSVAARRTGIVETGDCIVITAGVPFGGGGGTNLLMVQTLS
jgi:pyruvate kinase